jgi:hypothetical protein
VKFGQVEHLVFAGSYAAVAHLMTVDDAPCLLEVITTVPDGLFCLSQVGETASSLCSGGGEVICDLGQ